MFGVGRGITPLLVGWLWADILLGLFVIFLAAASAPVQAQSQAARAIDPTPLELTVAIDGAGMLSGDASILAAEQEKVLRAVSDAVGTRDVALVLAFASHEDPVLGDRIALLATEALATPPFANAVLKPMHSIVAGDAGTSLALEVYVYR